MAWSKEKKVFLAIISQNKSFRPSRSSPRSVLDFDQEPKFVKHIVAANIHHWESNIKYFSIFSFLTFCNFAKIYELKLVKHVGWLVEQRPISITRDQISSSITFLAPSQDSYFSISCLWSFKVIVSHKT